MKGKYKDEDSGIIFEYIKEKDEEAEKWARFSSAFKRKMVELYNKEEEVKRLKKRIKEQEEAGRYE